MKFSLKDVREQDHEWLVELHNDPDVLKNLTNPEPITLDSHMRWWNSLNRNKEKRHIFYVDDNRVGFTKIYSIDTINKNCVLGADIHKDYRGKGFAKHMWNLLVDECFSNLGLHRVSLTTACYNDIAQKVYKNLGFKEEGRNVESLYRGEKFYDCVCMYLLKTDWTK
jgi:RimJ/RimL family protein N-acetyltransferase